MNFILHPDKSNHTDAEYIGRKYDITRFDVYDIRKEMKALGLIKSKERCG